MVDTNLFAECAFINNIKWRKRPDSNGWRLLTSLRFKLSALNHSATLPKDQDTFDTLCLSITLQSQFLEGLVGFKPTPTALNANRIAVCIFQVV